MGQHLFMATVRRGAAKVLIGYFDNLMVTSKIGKNENMLGKAKARWIILAILRSPAKPICKDHRSCHSSFRLFWKSYGYHHNRYENPPGTFKVLMYYFGNLQVISKIGTKRCLEQPKLVGLFWQSCGHQQNWYEKTLGAAKIRIRYFGNLMVTITTVTKISLEHSKFLWIILAIFRSPAKLVREKSWHNQSSYRIFWQSYGWRHNRYENKLETD